MLALPPGGPRTLALLVFFSAPALGAGQPPAPPPSPVPPGEAVVVAAVENLYSSPSTDADVVSQAFVGQSLALLEERGGFARVETPDRYPGLDPPRRPAGLPGRRHAALRHARARGRG